MARPKTPDEIAAHQVKNALSAAVDPLRNPDVALLYDCTFCGAPAGEPCRNAAWGNVMELPHYSRTPVPLSLDDKLEVPF